MSNIINKIELLDIYKVLYLIEDLYLFNVCVECL